jgi:hypothetical protein
MGRTYKFTPKPFHIKSVNVLFKITRVTVLLLASNVFH